MHLRPAPNVTRFRHALSDSQRSKIKRELGAPTDLTAYDAAIPPPIDKARVMPRDPRRYPTSRALDVFAVAIKGILASTSELLLW